MPSDTRKNPKVPSVFGGDSTLLLDRLEEAMSGARIGWFQRDDTSEMLIGSGSCATIFGLRNEQGPWRFEEFANCVLPDDLAIYSAANQERASGTQSVRFRIRRGDGETAFALE